MSRTIFALVLALFSVLFSGCSVESVNNLAPQATNTSEQDGQKAKYYNFDGNVSEIAVFMAAISAADNERDQDASTYFKYLYGATGNKAYLLELVKLSSQTGDLTVAKELLLDMIAKDPKDIESKRMLISAYAQQKEYKEAFELAKSIADETKKKEDYDMVGSLAYILSNYASAEKYFRSSYAAKADDIGADRIATILVLEDKKQDATSFLETHTRLFGCSKYLCEKLANMYIEASDTKGALEIYKKLYFKTKSESYTKKIIELSVANTDIDGLIAFLKKSKKDEALLLEAYKYKKDNKKAAELANKLYKKTKDLNYLAQAAIYDIEGMGKKNDKTIKESVKNLTIVTSKMQNDVYDNYLGYLLIDYDIDTVKGMELVKRALVKDPTSPFYLDSLAWGYYKQKKCAEAEEIMEQIGGDAKKDKTVIEHMEAIKKCIQGKK
jgi:hypothetical protein